MLKQITIEPKGWPCKLKECEPGLFLYNNTLGFKSSYREVSGTHELFLASGESFWGGTSRLEERDELIVQPVWIRFIEKIVSPLKKTPPPKKEGPQGFIVKDGQEIAYNLSDAYDNDDEAEEE